MNSDVEVIGETEIIFINGPFETKWKEWHSKEGPPVPLKVEKDVWDTLLTAVFEASDPVKKPRVFRLFMKRREPRHVIHTSEILEVYRTQRGIVRWKEGKYPPITESFRKGGNFFVRGDVRLEFHDAWWMGRELTDLRILMAKEKDNKIRISAWWSRGDSSKNGTNGELWPVKLLVKK